MTCQSVAIIGSGPAGSTLATYLARAGKKVALFSFGKRPGLVVGESLVPAIIPYLQEMAIEEEVKGYSTFKPGATFFIRGQEEITFFFNQDKKLQPSYAYNVPRDLFDQTLMETAKKAGVKVFNHKVQLVLKNSSAPMALHSDALAATGGFFREQPDFIVDATGRSRFMGRFLDLPYSEGNRRDTVLFAHLDHTEITHEGHVHVNRLEKGWSWRIPLPGRVSVGIVAPHDYVCAKGRNSEEQFDHLLVMEPNLKAFVGTGRRISPVKKYSNYQMRTHQLYGKGWALVGDAAGFIDPVFSSGLLIAISSAKFLAKALLGGKNHHLVSYQEKVMDNLQSWQAIVDYFYDGRLMTVMEAGIQFKKSLFGKLVSPHVHHHVSRVMTGIGTTRPYSRSLLKFLIQYGLRDGNPKEVCIY